MHYLSYFSDTYLEKTKMSCALTEVRLFSYRAPGGACFKLMRIRSLPDIGIAIAEGKGIHREMEFAAIQIRGTY